MRQVNLGHVQLKPCLLCLCFPLQHLKNIVCLDILTSLLRCKCLNLMTPNACRYAENKAGHEAWLVQKYLTSASSSARTRNGWATTACPGGLPCLFLGIGAIGPDITSSCRDKFLISHFIDVKALEGPVELLMNASRTTAEAAPAGSCLDLRKACNSFQVCRALTIVSFSLDFSTCSAILRNDWSAN